MLWVVVRRVAASAIVECFSQLLLSLDFAVATYPDASQILFEYQKENQRQQHTGLAGYLVPNKQETRSSGWRRLWRWGWAGV
ncbi:MULTISPECIES: hypothetical protein [unclassified Mesorhizobium]|uniref:hypothetical protein n=1 Tax=unclassified Mesorhizobium TaxID=325217 RepID=UPI000FE02625|nr:MULTISPECIES: hypothetical protein [unclassified Mesorhizobium]TGS22140.1 hypothetical protein EN830_27290 [Mesorhizobium sp. M1C.F.Ca.ET.187.01.1.1]